MNNDNNGIVNIHGKEYKTVAARVTEAHEGNALKSVETEVLSADPVVVRAKVVIQKDEDILTFTGISAVIPGQAKNIEKENPYEVAETSAVGRALGFAGYGEVHSIASADEMAKAGATRVNGARPAADERLKERMDALAAYEPKGRMLTPEEKEMDDALAEVRAVPQPRTAEEDAGESASPKECGVHNELMFEGVSKTKFDSRGFAKTYWWHKGPEGQMCFGQGYKD